MKMPPNLLQESGLPLAFPTRADLSAPKSRLGTAVRAAVGSLTVMQKVALVVSSRHNQAWRLASDEGAYLGGHDFAPPPLAYLSAGMVASYMNEIEALAGQRGISTEALELTQDNVYSMRGSMQAGTMEAGAKDVALEMRMPGGLPVALQDIAPLAVAASPLNGLMAAPIESLFTLTHNGAGQPLDVAKPVDGPAEPDPGDILSDLTPLDGDWSKIVYGTGEPAPRGEMTVTFAGGALTDHQDRILHVRVIAKRRADDILAITLHLLNPAGTIFHFLSSEDGRAPDAETLICAGIGFCFMTQFGRFAKMGKYDLRSYRIVQDAQFSLAGASDGTGKAGTAEPLETHVHLHTGEDDAFARRALDIAEKTCFLHAFCRTPLKVRLRIPDVA